MNKVLIFGCNGFAANYLKELLISEQYTVYGCDIADSSQLGNNYFKCDILDFSSVKKIISKINPDYIYNLAAISSVGQSWLNPQLSISVNVIGTINILESIKDFVIKPRVLLVGSSEEYKEQKASINEKVCLNSDNPYGISKITQELFAKIYRNKFGIKIFCVRAFNHSGVGQKESFVIPSFCKQVAEIDKSGKPGIIYVGNINVYRDFSDVRDVVRAYKTIIESDDDSIVYNVGSGNTYLLKDILLYVISLSNQKIDIVVDDKKIRPSDIKFVQCDNSLIKNKLGWQPKHNFKETIYEMFSFYRNNEPVK